jgi:hypothetical protein
MADMHAGTQRSVIFAVAFGTQEKGCRKRLQKRGLPGFVRTGKKGDRMVEFDPPQIVDFENL